MFHEQEHLPEISAENNQFGIEKEVAVYQITRCFVKSLEKVSISHRRFITNDDLCAINNFCKNTLIYDAADACGIGL